MKILVLNLITVVMLFATNVDDKLNKAFIELEKGNSEFVYYSIAQLANKGNPVAQYLLARVYATDNFKKDEKESFKLFEKSAKQGYAKSLNALGVAYYNGIGVEKDYKMAMKYFKEAINKGDFSANNNIGVIYERGNGVIQNYQKAYKHYLLAFKDGDKKIAPYNIAMLSINNKYLKYDNKKIVKFLELASKNSNPNATYRLGLAYKYGYLGLKEDAKKAFNYFYQAYKNGHKKATSCVGESYFLGNGVEQDINLGMALIVSMSKENDAYAQYLLGVAYYHKGDLTSSAYYLRKAWQNGSKKAWKMLADNSLWNKKRVSIKK
jgi:TPR repeat protein